MVGLLIGSFTFGVISDYYGRLKAMMLAIIIVAVSGALGAIPGSGPVWFTMMRFLTGFGAKGLFMIAFVMTVECVGQNVAMLMGIAINIPFAVGEMILVWEAYAFRDWYSLQLMAHLPTLLLLLLWFFVPESPRWLIASGNRDDAINIINQGARMNGKKTPVKLYFMAKNSIGEDKHKKLDCKEIEGKRVNLLSLFRPNIMCFRSLNLFVQWFSVTFCYYGKTIFAIIYNDAGNNLP